VPDGPFQKLRQKDSLEPQQPEKVVAVFNPGAGRLPTPQALAEYAAIDPSYPQSLMASFQLELKRNYHYQLVALVAGWTFALSLAVEAGFLAVRGHEKMALALIGANAIGLATRMLTKAASRK
jgi:hypothetical protein